MFLEKSYCSNSFFHLTHYIRFNHLLSQYDHVLKGFRVGDTMTYNDRLCYAEDRCAAIIFEVETVKIFVFKILSFANFKQRFRKF